MGTHQVNAFKTTAGAFFKQLSCFLTPVIRAEKFVPSDNLFS